MISITTAQIITTTIVDPASLRKTIGLGFKVSPP
jgi:hypothetical protein